MGFYIKLGLRNIGRNRLRSALTILAVVLCSSSIILYSTMLSGMMDMVFSGLTSQIGHVRMINPKLAKNERLGRGYYFIQNVDSTIKKLKKVEGVDSILPRIDLGAFVDHEFRPEEEKKLAKSGQCMYQISTQNTDETDQVSKKGTITKQTPGMGLGVLPKAEVKAQDLDKKIVKGRLLHAKGKEVVIGTLLAERLRACVGSKITLMSKTVYDSPSGITLRVVGIVNMGNALFNKMFMVSLSTAQYLSELPNQASSILVFGKNIWDAKQLAARIKRQKWAKQIYVEAWQQNSFARTMLPIMKIMLFILGGFVVFIGGIGLLNAMMMSIIERQKEVGIMMALGLTPKAIASIFLTEGVVFGVIGGIGGVILGVLGSIPLITTGISFGVKATEKIPLPLASTLKGVLTFEGILVGLLVGVFATIVGALWPSYKAAQLDPVNILRK